MRRGFTKTYLADLRHWTEMAMQRVRSRPLLSRPRQTLLAAKNSQFKPLISSGQALHTLEISSTTTTSNFSPKGLKYSSRYLPFSPDRTGVQSSRAQAGFELHKWQDTHLHLIRALFLLVVWLAFLMEWESGEMYVTRILLNPSNLLSCIIQD